MFKSVWWADVALRSSSADNSCIALLCPLNRPTSQPPTTPRKIGLFFISSRSICWLWRLLLIGDTKLWSVVRGCLQCIQPHSTLGWSSLWVHMCYKGSACTVKPVVSRVFGQTEVDWREIMDLYLHWLPNSSHYHRMLSPWLSGRGRQGTYLRVKRQPERGWSRGRGRP